ncbi:hypothetical protein H5410_014380 [Solanum commersonii]|uniref:Uncharacterized protein n=1 Tax=Solanum commersonii TaxID=4109 RepID=A0A9J5ZR85_SOLCO|nr:hypothetical protein H5410_014380 [Solanum commersonii]
MRAWIYGHCTMDNCDNGKDIRLLVSVKSNTPLKDLQMQDSCCTERKEKCADQLSCCKWGSHKPDGLLFVSRSSEYERAKRVLILKHFGSLIPNFPGGKLKSSLKLFSWSLYKAKGHLSCLASFGVGVKVKVESGVTVFVLDLGLKSGSIFHSDKIEKYFLGK